MQKGGLILLLGVAAAQSDTIEFKLNPILIHAERHTLLEPKRIFITEETGNLTLGEALTRVAGVDWMQTGGFLTGRPVLRGHSYTRVGWIMSGLIREGAYWGEDHGYETPPQLLTFETEILLGPQSVRYGSDAIGGIVRFQPLVPTQPFIHLQATAFSNPAGFLIQGGGSVGNTERFLMGEVTLHTAENFYTPRHGFVWNTGMRSGYAYLTGRISPRKYLVEFQGFQTAQLLGIPSPIWNTTNRQWYSEAQGRYISRREAWRFQRDLPFQRILSSGGQVRILREHTSGSTTALIWGAQRNERAEYGEHPSEPEVRLLTTRTDIDLSHRWKAGEGGITGFVRQTRDEGEEPFLPRVLHGEGGIWFRQSFVGSRGQIAWGGRLHGGFSQARSQHKTYLTWAGELTYAYAGHTLRLTRGFRIPHPAELWASGFHEGAKRYEYGSPDLPVEIAYTAEYLLSLSSMQVRPFFQYVPRYIFAERIPDTLPSAVGAAFIYRTRRAILTGAEVEWQLNWFSVGVSYVYGQFLLQRQASERFIPRMPPLRLRLSGRHRLKTWVLLPELLLYAPQNRAYSVHGTEVPTPGYILFHFTAQWRFLAFGIQNALSSRYQPHLSPYRQWIPRGIDFPSQNFFLRLNLVR
ncbi:MAG: TonB-dependent receptor [Bacteroidia bacterium]|nr:TonB-dependent receptor [Bacteroidia bacterium]